MEWLFPYVVGIVVGIALDNLFWLAYNIWKQK
jgi:hypothetical protein